MYDDYKKTKVKTQDTKIAACDVCGNVITSSSIKNVVGALWRHMQNVHPNTMKHMSTSEQHDFRHALKESVW